MACLLQGGHWQGGRGGGRPALPRRQVLGKAAGGAGRQIHYVMDDATYEIGVLTYMQWVLRPVMSAMPQGGVGSSLESVLNRMLRRQELCRLCGMSASGWAQNVAHITGDGAN